MNIVYIIGNGFDLNLGMKTRYSDFYEYYKNSESKNNLVINLKNEISESIHNWSDLELAFGDYTKYLNSVDEFDQVYEDIVDNLGDYLISIEDKFDFSKINVSKFCEYLCRPEKSLNEEDIQEILTFKKQWITEEWNIDIITLNYTNTIEKFIGEDPLPIEIGNHHGYRIILRNLHHIHGYTNERTIMGVNDISQIAKKEFHDNQEILESLIKTKCNNVQRHNVDKKCAKLISNAQIICVFGSSIGDSDNYLWQSIGEQIKIGIKVIIFSKGEEIKERFAQRKARNQRSIKKLFLDKTNLTKEEKEKFEENIYVGINSNMFKNIN